MAGCLRGFEKILGTRPISTGQGLATLPEPPSFFKTSWVDLGWSLYEKVINWRYPVYHMDIFRMTQPSTIDIVIYCYISLFKYDNPFSTASTKRMGCFFFFRAPVLRGKPTHYNSGEASAGTIRERQRWDAFKAEGPWKYRARETWHCLRLGRFGEGQGWHTAFATNDLGLSILAWWQSLTVMENHWWTPYEWIQLHPDMADFPPTNRSKEVWYVDRQLQTGAGPRHR